MNEEYIFEHAEEIVKAFDNLYGKLDDCCDYRKSIQELKREVWILREALYRMRSRIEQNNNHN